MRPPSIRLPAALALPIALLLAASAGCGDGNTGGPCTTTADCRNGQRCERGTCVNPTDASADGNRDGTSGMDGTTGNDGGGGSCRDNRDCPGALCIRGACCATEHACNDACCGAAEVCFANACVTPGRTCHSNSDCESGSYCEPALGSGGMTSPDGGMPDAARTDAASDGGTTGPVCSAPSAVAGRCIALPPRCPAGTGADAGVGDGGTACIASCEYRPPVGRLDSTLAWSWGQPAAPPQYPNFIDVWSTPAVGRIYDANCDGRVDTLDPPDLVFVSGRSIDAMTGIGTCCQCTNTTPIACQTGVLRVLDGRTGTDLLAVRAAPGSMGFAGVSVALGDLDGDRNMDIAAVTGEGRVVVLDRTGAVSRTSDVVIPGHGNAAFGWGGGLAIADMDNDGFAEIAYGPTVFTTAGGTLHLLFTGTGGGGGGGAQEYLSTFADVDGAADHHLELVAGRTVYRANGTPLWDRTDLPDGFPAVADLDRDGQPEVVLVSTGQLWVLNGRTGATRLGPLTLPGMGFGGPPTVADFDGAPGPEIGVAQANYYAVVKPDFTRMQLSVLWRTANHDLSSSVTGSTVFDFEGDGVAEVLYADECFVWVYDGPTGNVRWAGLTTSFTGTEASIVADIDGDGHAEIVSVANGADPSPAGWGCNTAPWNTPDMATGRPAWRPPAGAAAYRGIRVYRDVARSWVGTRPMWNQHTYHVSNVCVATDDACTAPSYDGEIPRVERANWTLPWLNNFRQNVQAAGLFSAPDATVSLVVRCTDPLVLVASVRNLGEAILPSGVEVGFYVRAGGTDTLIGRASTTTALFPNGVQDVTLNVPAGTDVASVFVAKILVDPMSPAFRECRSDNDVSQPARAPCPG